jgi:iron-sulfur cluster repair protein YtfE (RIC family)
MDLYQLLKRDHQKAKRLFERLGETSITSKARQRLFAELKEELELHTEVEEKYFYPALQHHNETRDLVEEALDEHREAKVALEELDEADKDDESWPDQLAELQEDVEHHIEEEETKLFPLAQKLLESAEMQRITQAIEQDKEAARAGH